MIDLAKQGSQTFVFGAVILMVSNILVKIIGAVFKIPLTNIIGVDGMAYFNAAYSIYVTLYNVSTSGLPVAISRMVAAENAGNNLKAANRIFSVAFRLFFFIGLAGTLIMTLFADRFAAICGIAQAKLATMVIAPTLFFICLSSACFFYQIRIFFHGSKAFSYNAAIMSVFMNGKYRRPVINPVFRGQLPGPFGYAQGISSIPDEGNAFFLILFEMAVDYTFIHTVSMFLHCFFIVDCVHKNVRMVFTKFYCLCVHLYSSSFAHP